MKHNFVSKKAQNNVKDMWPAPTKQGTSRNSQVSHSTCTVGLLVKSVWLIDPIIMWPALAKQGTSRIQFFGLVHINSHCAWSAIDRPTFNSLRTCYCKIYMTECQSKLPSGLVYMVE